MIGRRRLSLLQIGCCALILVCGGASASWPDGIDVEALRHPWHRQHVHSLEVGRYPVRWRQAVSRAEGLKVGVRFTAPLPRQQVWTLTTDYRDVGQMTPGIVRIHVTEESPQRQVIEMDVKVLWKRLRLVFEVEQDPPREIRFRWRDAHIGELRGLCVLEESSSPDEANGTLIEFSTWFRPFRPVPLGLLTVVERTALLQSVKQFLKACEAQGTHAVTAQGQREGFVEAQSAAQQPSK